MRQIILRFLPFVFTLIVSTQLSAAPMFEDLKFGDTKKEVQKKLFKSKRLTSPAATMLGRTGLNGFFTTKQQISGLKFKIHFGWNDEGALKLDTVDLYSQESSRANLEKAFQQARQLLTEIYGKPKFDNGLPSNQQVPESGMVLHGSCWFYQEHAVLMGIGKTDKGHALIISFQQTQPQLNQTP